MKQLIIVLLLIAASVALWACKQGHEYILLVNKSDKKIMFQEFTDRMETSFYCYGGQFIPPPIYPGESFFMSSSNPRGWELDLKNDTFGLLVGDYEIWKQYWLEPCDTIRKYVPILHRYWLTLEELEQMNWKIVYPPKE